MKGKSRVTKISELISDIRNQDLVLPEFQREYVWNQEQAKQLMVSLFRGYPTGSLLFWKTTTPPELKNTALPQDKLGTTQVILDGQQRLTTLYLFIASSIPPYYQAQDIKTDPRDLYFDLETGEFQYYQVTRMKNNPTWIPVTACFSASDDVRVFDIVQKKFTVEGATEEQFKGKSSLGHFLMVGVIRVASNHFVPKYPGCTIPHLLLYLPPTREQVKNAVGNDLTDSLPAIFSQDKKFGEAQARFCFTSAHQRKRGNVLVDANEKRKSIRVGPIMIQVGIPKKPKRSHIFSVELTVVMLAKFHQVAQHEFFLQ
jgi:hypothetical protein